MLLVAAAMIFSFVAGHAADERRHARLIAEEGRRQFLECLSAAIDLGIVTVDQQRLDEAVCAASEESWEDEDAAASERGVPPATERSAGAGREEARQ